MHDDRIHLAWRHRWRRWRQWRRKRWRRGCPCTVGNSGIHFTLGCGESQCIDLNGQEIGYICGQNGATENPAICLPGFDAGIPPGYDAGPCGMVCTPPQTCGGGGVANFCGCTPKSCSELSLCGSTFDDCDAAVTCPGCEAGAVCSLGSHCETAATNLVVIGNYQGGSFAINVDQHLPNLGIGLVSYEAMQVTIGGTYASDVVQVVHAGYEPGTTVAGVAAGSFVDQLLPRVSPDAGPADLLIDDIPNNPAPPTKAQIVAYFQAAMGGGTLAFHECQYDAYAGTLQISQGGTCN